MTRQGKAYPLSESTRLAVAEVLIAKSRLEPSHCQENPLQEAMEILGDEIPDHMRALIALRRSTIARLHGDYHKSEDVIVDFEKRAPSHASSNARLRSLVRLVLISRLENLVQLEDYGAAEKRIHDLEDWEPAGREPWSAMELSVSFKKWASVSKIYQANGQLEDARSYLQSCYCFLQPQGLRADPIRFQIICRLADFLCAEGEYADARSKIESEIQLISTHNHGRFAKALRRLKVSLVDVDIAEKQYDQASLDIVWLKQRFNQVQSPDISDQWLHVRALVTSARLWHCRGRFQDAIVEWEAVLLLLKKYPRCFSPKGFFYGLCQLSISIARLQLARSTEEPPHIASLSWHDETRHTFHEGCTILIHEDMNYWIPTLPRTVIPGLLSSVASMDPDCMARDQVFLRLRQKYSCRSSRL